MKTSADPIYEYAPRVGDMILKRKYAEDVLSMAYHHFLAGCVHWH
jgi:hypothetical protein